MKYNRSTANLDNPPKIHFNGHIRPAKSHSMWLIILNKPNCHGKQLKGSVMHSAALNTNNLLRSRPKHVKLSPCPIEISPQLKANSLDANKAHCGALEQATIWDTLGLIQPFASISYN